MSMSAQYREARSPRLDPAPPPSIRAVQAFVAVAELSSYRAAAERLFLDGSTVSRLVSRLEKTLGTELLDRNTRHVELSAAGRAALKPAQQALVALRDLTDEVDAVRRW
jgi:DNA-binding transcriptional LysR family regulator